MTDWHYVTLLEAGEAVKSGQVSSVELTHAMLQRIARLEPSLHAYATLSLEIALDQAARADAAIAAGVPLGPLHGVPVAVKDICDTAGTVTASGMSIRAAHVPAEDSTVVARLAAAGAVLLGKVQNTEGAFAKHHPAIAVPSNPWNADYYAGASSSGSGVAAAAGMAFATIGSDTGGSIRFPSSANGVTGLKPTWGRVSRHGVFPLAPSLDHIGPLARTAADAGAVLGAIAGLDPRDPTSLAAPVPDYLADLDRGIRGIRIGVDRVHNEAGVDAVIVKTLEAAVSVFAALGATLHEITIPDTQAVTANWGSLAGIEAAINHAATYPARAAEYGPAVSGSIASLIDHGRTVSAIDLMQVHYDRLAFSGALATMFAGIDLLLIPTQPLADFSTTAEAALFERPEDLTAFLRFVAPYDMAGVPTITLPGGFTERGLPLSFQLVGRALDEALLVRAGHAYQQATGWHHRHPSL